MRALIIKQDTPGVREVRAKQMGEFFGLLVQNMKNHPERFETTVVVRDKEKQEISVAVWAHGSPHANIHFEWLPILTTLMRDFTVQAIAFGKGKQDAGE